MLDTPLKKHGVSAAVNDATQEIGAAIGIAIARREILSPTMRKPPSGAEWNIQRSPWPSSALPER
ncbi:MULTISPECIES: hypothetical protein [Nocardia]|uniref:hypothetical protein n=1 Tax=Nocardia TaxID=1817 RepID=UPI001878407E|nr:MULTISPECIES: hypothetical protein [Nocardia]MBF6278730.1 hypothetical protein [Nocardia nova]